MSSFLQLLLGSWILSTKTTGYLACNGVEYTIGSNSYAYATGICTVDSEDYSASLYVCINGSVFLQTFPLSQSDCSGIPYSEINVCSNGRQYDSCVSICDQKLCKYYGFVSYEGVRSCDPLDSVSFSSGAFITGYCYQWRYAYDVYGYMYQCNNANYTYKVYNMSTAPNCIGIPMNEINYAIDMFTWCNETFAMGSYHTCSNPANSTYAPTAAPSDLPTISPTGAPTESPTSVRYVYVNIVDDPFKVTYDVYLCICAGLVSLFLFVILVSCCHLKCYSNEQYDLKAISLFVFLMYLLDFIADLFFSIHLLYDCHEDAIFLGLFIGSVLFIVLPLIVSLYQMKEFIWRYIEIHTDDIAMKDYFANYATILYLICGVVGNFDATLSLFSCNLFNWDVFG
eukprot:85157_1